MFAVQDMVHKIADSMALACTGVLFGFLLDRYGILGGLGLGLPVLYRSLRRRCVLTHCKGQHCLSR